MIIPEVSPALECVQTADGFQYELLLRAPKGLPAITKIRIGPYFFRSEFQPRPFSFPFNLLGLSRSGPETGFWMKGRTVAALENGWTNGTRFWQKTPDAHAKRGRRQAWNLLRGRSATQAGQMVSGR